MTDALVPHDDSSMRSCEGHCRLPSETGTEPLRRQTCSTILCSKVSWKQKWNIIDEWKILVKSLLFCWNATLKTVTDTVHVISKPCSGLVTGFPRYRATTCILVFIYTDGNVLYNNWAVTTSTLLWWQLVPGEFWISIKHISNIHP